MSQKLELAMVILLESGQQLTPEAMREAAGIIRKLRAGLEWERAAIHRIGEQATRRHRATGLKKYLLRDLEIIEQIVTSAEILATQDDATPAIPGRVQNGE
jgi:hypothetical protein